MAGIGGRDQAMDASQSALASVRRTRRMTLAAVLVAALLFALLGPASPAHAGTASYTSTNSAVDAAIADPLDPAYVDPAGLCLNGPDPDPVNCNLYGDAEYVWLNAGPTGAALAAGEYFFAVLAPGGQSDPNDGSPSLLSTTPRSERTFSVDALGALTYTGTHDFDDPGNKVRLMPFSQSANGVHILAICALPADDGDAVAHDCKFDAFKVQQGGEDPNEVNAVFQGTKFNDTNGNGLFDTGETGIAGWGITIYSVDGSDVRTVAGTTATDANGDFFFQSADVDEGTSEHFVVCEVQQSNWRQTGPVVAADTPTPVTDAFDLAAASASGGATVAQGTGTGEAMCYDVTTDGSSNATASFLDFFNVADVELSGAKYYDADESGARAVGEALVAGWPVSIKANGTEVCRVTTDTSGNWSSDDCASPLLPGTYTVEEIQPAAGTTWWQTGNLADASAGTGGATTDGLTSFVYTVTLPNTPAPATEAVARSGLDFGNACEVQVTSTPGGRTKGFWRNTNGQKLLTAADFTELTALNLVNQNGSARDFTASLSTNKTALKNWLEDSTATNMAYMLSAQMAATVLNINHGFTNPDAPVDEAGTTVQDVIDAANASLGTHPNTRTAGAARTYQQDLKNILDKVNNNRTFSWMVTSPTACALPTTWAS